MENQQMSPKKASDLEKLAPKERLENAIESKKKFENFLSAKKTLISSIVKSKKDREGEKYEVDEFKVEAASALEALSMVRTMEIAVLESTLDDYLKYGLSNARKELAEKFLSQRNQLLRSVELMNKEFYEIISDKWKNIENIPETLSKLKQSGLNELEDAIDKNSSAVKSLVNNFYAVINTGVRSEIK